MTSRLLLAGQTKGQVEECAKFAPRYKRSFTARLLPGDPTEVDVVNYNADFGALKRKPEFLDEAHAAGITVFAWTLNDEE